MAHPDVHARLAALSPLARSEEWLEASLRLEKQKGPLSCERCGCGRQQRWGPCCVWCLREMLCVVKGWE